MSYTFAGYRSDHIFTARWSSSRCQRYSYVNIMSYMFAGYRSLRERETRTKIIPSQILSNYDLNGIDQGRKQGSIFWLSENTHWLGDRSQIMSAKFRGSWPPLFWQLWTNWVCEIYVFTTKNLAMVPFQTYLFSCPEQNAINPLGIIKT